MHSFRWKLLLVGSVIGSVRGAVLPTPAITPAPRPAEVVIQSLKERQDPDAVSLAQVLLTALPLSLRLIAATNVPAVSSILWEEFLDDNKPQWFLELPWDIQSYLITEFGPQTAWPTAPPTTESWGSQTTATTTPTSAVESPTPSGSESLSTVSKPTASSSDQSISGSSTASSTSLAPTSSLSRTSIRSSAPTSSATDDPVAPSFSSSGLTRQQKIGLGVGIPLGLLGVAALLFGCCFLLRRQRRRNIEGNEPPSSPGFIPRFSFQDRGLSYEHHEHRAPLNPGYNQSAHDAGDMNWEDDGYEPEPMDTWQRTNTYPPAAAPMTMHDPKPIMAPALYHTHSSNRARGKRTSYTSLHSVAEVTEPDDDMAESPVLGRHQSLPKTGRRRPSLPPTLEMPPVPAAATIKRKPVPTSPTGISPAAEAASRSLLRPTLINTTTNHSGSSSSGLVLSSASSSSRLSYQNESPISPLSHQAPKNPFADTGYAYLEDYGPEYSNNGYADLEDGLYGGHKSLDRYPGPSPSMKNSKTEWPLRNVVGMGSRRNRSPMWDRVYEK